MVDANQLWKLKNHPSNDWKFWVATKTFPSNAQNIWLPNLWSFNLTTEFFMHYLIISNNNWKYFGQRPKTISHWINGGDPTIANKTINFFGQHPKKIWVMTKKNSITYFGDWKLATKQFSIAIYFFKVRPNIWN
jgi:hypothetical protein